MGVGYGCAIGLSLVRLGGCLLVVVGMTTGCTKIKFTDQGTSESKLALPTGEGNPDPLDPVDPPGVPPVESPENKNWNTEMLHGKQDGQQVDILWVIDNSSSMETSQQALADNFDSFIGEFQTQNYDFQMGITTTEAYKATLGYSRDHALLKSGGKLGSSGASILTNKTPNLKDSFLKNVLQGDAGDSDERAFMSLKTVLSNTANRGLIRPEAHLAVIVVSDEDDLSHDGDYWTESNYYNIYKDPNLHKPSDYQKLLVGLKGSADKASFHAIAIKDEKCYKDLGGQSRKIGKRYFELVSLMGGTTVDLCSDFSKSLKFLSNFIIRRTLNFVLTKKPVDATDIQVQMRGVTAPRNRSQGWDYFPETQSLQFFGEWVPANGEAVTVKYQVP